MRIMPFMKRKKGVQFAGIGLDTGGGGSYVLPPATENTLGGIKVGSGLSVESDGTLSVEGGNGLIFSTAETAIGTFNNSALYARVFISTASSTNFLIDGMGTNTCRVLAVFGSATEDYKNKCITKWTQFASNCEVNFDLSTDSTNKIVCILYTK